MKRIKKFDMVLRKEKTLVEAGINSIVFQAYADSCRRGYSILNFDEAIWEKDIEPIIGICRQEGFEKITISSTQCGIGDLLLKFQQHGCKIDGMTKVDRSYYIKEERAAFIIKIY